MYELVSPVSPRSILKYTGYLLLMIGVIIAVPAVAALILGEIASAAIYAASGGATLLAGGVLIRTLPECELHPKEAIVLAAIVFPLSSIINAVPFALVNNLPPLDALFESVSGLTTTGLSVAPAGVSALFLFARSWAQWVGGIGIVVLALSILTTPGASAFRLFDANIGETRLRPNVAGTARVLGRVYAGITLLAFILLLLAGMPLFDAICQTFTTVSTGGFSTKPESIAGFEGAGIPIAVAFGCIMGAVNFALYPKLFRAPRAALASIQLRYFVLFLLLGTVGLAITIPGDAPVISVSEAAFQATSALTTAGFSTIDIGALPDTAKAVLTVLMWIGGGLGSTAGGIKIVRIVILAQLVRIVFIRFFCTTGDRHPAEDQWPYHRRAEAQLPLHFHPALLRRRRPLGIRRHAPRCSHGRCGLRGLKRPRDRRPLLRDHRCRDGRNIKGGLDRRYAAWENRDNSPPDLSHARDVATKAGSYRRFRSGEDTCSPYPGHQVATQDRPAGEICREKLIVDQDSDWQRTPERRMVQIDPLILLSLALGPGIFWVWYFYHRDRYDPEPPYLVLRMFLLGIAVTFPVAFLEGGIGILIASPLILAVIVAPVVEEYGKYFVVRRGVYRNREFDEPMDGIVYATAAALGFASLENLIYVFSAYTLSLEAAIGTIVVRALFSVPAHALFASIWGYALGRAKFSPPEQRRGIVARGLAAAMVLHGLFNFLLITAEVYALAMLVFFLVLIPGMWLLVNRNIGRALDRGR